MVYPAKRGAPRGVFTFGICDATKSAITGRINGRKLCVCLIECASAVRSAGFVNLARRLIFTAAGAALFLAIFTTLFTTLFTTSTATGTAATSAPTGLRCTTGTALIATTASRWRAATAASTGTLTSFRLWACRRIALILRLG